MHFYQQHVGDYRRDTGSLSILEHGAYRLLMDEYYVTERRLPADTRELWRICRAMSGAERLAVSRVVERFFVIEGSELSHKRIDAEIADYKASVNNGKRGGRPPNGKPKANLNHNLDPNLNESPPVTNHEPVTSNQVTAIQTPRGIPASVAQAVSIGKTAGVPATYAETIFLEHDGATWEDGQGRPINNFASYLKSRYTNRTDKLAREEKRYERKPNGATAPNASPKTDTVWSLTESIKSITESLVEIDSSISGAWGELSPAKKEERRKLVERRKDLRRKLSGLEATA